MLECAEAPGIIAWGPVLVKEGGKASQNQQLENYESINKIPESTRPRKILAKDRVAMEEPLRLPNGNVTRTPGEALGVLLESHFLDVNWKVSEYH